MSVYLLFFLNSAIQLWEPELAMPLDVINRPVVSLGPSEIFLGKLHHVVLAVQKDSLIDVHFSTVCKGLCILTDRRRHLEVRCSDTTALRRIYSTYKSGFTCVGSTYTSMDRPSSWAAAADPTATATAAEAATRPCLFLGSSFLSTGMLMKSGAATGCTNSTGKTPDRPWMAPNFQPLHKTRHGVWKFACDGRMTF